MIQPIPFQVDEIMLKDSIEQNTKETSSTAVETQYHEGKEAEFLNIQDQSIIAVVNGTGHYIIPENA